MSVRTNTLFQNQRYDQILAKTLPLLPGYNFNFNNIGENCYKKTQHFVHDRGIIRLHDNNKEGCCIPLLPPNRGSNIIPVLREKESSNLPLKGVRGISCEEPYNNSSCIYPKESLKPMVPSWIAFDKQVLRFEGYFQEPIPESWEENYRIHNCKILYYLEDDTIQVMEPPTHCGISQQGQIIRRQKISLPSCPDQYFSWEHFNVGSEITLFAKTFFICSCDRFTRQFLNKLGISVPGNISLPVDVATEKRKDMKACQFGKMPHVKIDTRVKFNQLDRQVLRFWAYWDDRSALYGDLREFVIHFYLKDDTMEIREIIRPNSGYDTFPVFIRKMKIPKNPSKTVSLPGSDSPYTILNTFGSIHGTKNKRPHYMVDYLALGSCESQYYRVEDLAIGSIVNVYGRTFLLYDCDEFTKHYYREKFNIQDFTPLILNEPKKELPKPEVPPYNGWGTEEDSLQSWKSLELKNSVKDIRKSADKEKEVLRFEAKFHNALQKVNQSRRFVINYYMADDTIQVFEKEHPNTGLPKGTFLHRDKLKKPGYDPIFGKPAEYFDQTDFYVGNTLDLNGFRFQLIKADEFTLSYMEQNKSQFPTSDVCAILEKVREAFGPLQFEEVFKCFSENDTLFQGVMDIRNFRNVLVNMTKGGLSEHEIVTLSRAYASNNPSPGTDFQTVQAVAQTELRRFNFDRILMARIEYTLRHYDPCRSGKIDRETLRSTLKGAKIPLFRELLDFIIDKFPPADDEDPKCNRIDYCNLMKFLDWEGNPAPIAKPASEQCVMKWVEPKAPMKIFCINYRRFLEDACPNFKSSIPAINVQNQNQDQNNQQYESSPRPITLQVKPITISPSDQSSFKCEEKNNEDNCISNSNNNLENISSNNCNNENRKNCENYNLSVAYSPTRMDLKAL